MVSNSISDAYSVARMKTPLIIFFYIVTSFIFFGVISLGDVVFSGVCRVRYWNWMLGGCCLFMDAVWCCGESFHLLFFELCGRKGMIIFFRNLSKMVCTLYQQWNLMLLVGKQ